MISSENYAMQVSHAKKSLDFQNLRENDATLIKLQIEVWTSFLRFDSDQKKMGRMLVRLDGPTTSSHCDSCTIENQLLKCCSSYRYVHILQASCMVAWII